MRQSVKIGKEILDKCDNSHEHTYYGICEECQLKALNATAEAERKEAVKDIRGEFYLDNECDWKGEDLILELKRKLKSKDQQIKRLEEELKELKKCDSSCAVWKNEHKGIVLSACPLIEENKKLTQQLKAQKLCHFDNPEDCPFKQSIQNNGIKQSKKKVKE